MGRKLKIFSRNRLSPTKQPTLLKMSFAFTWLQSFERSFGLFSRDFTPEHIVDYIALLGRVKTLLEAALPRARQRQAAQVQQARQAALRAQRAAESKEEAIARWIKRTEKRPRVLKISELKRPTEEPCGICLENHTGEEMIACGCNHQFGKNCFLLMVKTNLSSSHPVLCPLCRVPVKSFSGFRQRAAPKPRNPVVA
jgi:hypothetical protein